MVERITNNDAEFIITLLQEGLDGSRSPELRARYERLIRVFLDADKIEIGE